MKMKKNMPGMALAGLLLLSLSTAAQGADPAKGQQLYAANCAICHGQNGRSTMPGAPSFDRGDGLLRPDFSLLASIRAGKNAMPAFQGRLADRDIMDVIAFMRTMR